MYIVVDPSRATKFSYGTWMNLRCLIWWIRLLQIFLWKLNPTRKSNHPIWLNKCDYSSHSKVLQPDSNIESKERLEHQFFFRCIEESALSRDTRWSTRVTVSFPLICARIKALCSRYSFSNSWSTYFKSSTTFFGLLTKLKSSPRTQSPKHLGGWCRPLRVTIKDFTWSTQDQVNGWIHSCYSLSSNAYIFANQFSALLVLDFQM